MDKCLTRLIQCLVSVLYNALELSPRNHLYSNFRSFCKVITINVLVLSGESNATKRGVKEAFAVKQRHPSLKRKEGLGLPTNYNPLLGIRNNLSFS